MKLETNHEKNNEEHTNPWKLNNTLLSNERFNKEVKEEIRRSFEANEDKDTIIQNLGDHGK